MSASQNNAVLRFVKLTEHARTPTRGSPKSAGLQLYSAYDTTVPAKEKTVSRQSYSYRPVVAVGSPLVPG